MDFLINIILFVLTLILTHKPLKKINCRELSMIFANLGILYLFYYLVAKYFNVGIAIMGKHQPIANPDNIIKTGPPFVIFMAALFMLAYIFEWWYYKFFLPSKGVSSSEEYKTKLNEIKKKTK